MYYGMIQEEFILVLLIFGICSPFLLMCLKVFEMKRTGMSLSAIIDQHEMFFSLLICSQLVFLLYLFFFSNRLQVEYENGFNIVSTVMYVIGIVLLIVSTKYYYSKD